VLVGLLWVGIGLIFLISIYVNAFADVNKFFLFSATVQVLLTAISLIIYLYQLSKIYQVVTYAPIIQTQKKLAQLNVSTLKVTKIIFLQLPVWTIFWWNDSMLVNWSIMQWNCWIRWMIIRLTLAPTPDIGLAKSGFQTFLRPRQDRTSRLISLPINLNSLWD